MVPLETGPTSFRTEVSRRAALALREDLRALLGQHNLKEEHVLYPGTDRCLAPEERDALVARIQGS